MTKPTKRSLWLFWIPLSLAVAIFLFVTFIGNILVIGAKLGGVTPWLEWGFYGFVMTVFIWFVIAPFAGALAKPVLALEDVAVGNNNLDHEKLKKVARQLIDADVLPREQREELAGAMGLGSDIREPLAAAIKAQKKSTAKIIHEHAVLVFITTAISQNGRLDAIAVLVANFRLVRLLVKHFGYRPPLPMLIKIYAQIFLASLIANELDDLDAGSIFGYLGFGGVAAALGAGLIVNSLFDGTINALFTLRVGFVTRKYLLNAGNELSRSEVRKEANKEAMKALIPVVEESGKKLPSAMKTILDKILNRSAGGNAANSGSK
ncbi:MAG TPA: hypothetical protein PLT00_08335 [Verrucomicrobiota bacterium]|jgi:hypothetical protein|nr:MAG: hypothetical protein BWX84_00511 [Verrucomicrobia bacterium ADurb.Bin118]HPY30162.1 hypothetical protein [Verrucomicrobiota bacterium]HQB16703.1 hypothetical protein [Verrucomicrobiota bacterium]